MNVGVFMEEKDKLYFYTFENFSGEVPIEVLGNAIVSLGNEDYYVVTAIKNRKVNPSNLYIVINNKVLENPFEISTEKTSDIFGKITKEFKIAENKTYSAPVIENFAEALRKAGFYRADKLNFKRAIMRDKFERRSKRAN